MPERKVAPKDTAKKAEPEKEKAASERETKTNHFQARSTRETKSRFG